MKHIFLISPYWRENHRWMVSTVKLAALWQQLGFRVTVLAMGSSVHSHIEKEVMSDTLIVYRVRDFFLPDPWNYGIAWGFGAVALRLVRELRPDYIVVNKILFWTSFSLFRLRLAGFRVLLLSDALVGMTWWPRARFTRFCSALYAWTAGLLLLRMAHLIVFFHPQPSAFLRFLGIFDKVRVIPTGIDAKRYDTLRFVSEDQNALVTATYIGRLESIKGVDDFIVAALQAQRDCPTLRIQVVGWYTSGHPLVARYQSQVSFLGLRDDIPRILAESDIFVLPSYAEGLSNALMEAMASRCACVASDTGGNAFLLRNGVSGFLFPAGDTEALAAHLRRLVMDPHKRYALGEQARLRIEREFDWSVVGEKYRSLFDATLT